MNLVILFPSETMMTYIFQISFLKRPNLELVLSRGRMCPRQWVILPAFVPCAGQNAVVSLKHTHNASLFSRCSCFPNLAPALQSLALGRWGGDHSNHSFTEPRSRWNPQNKINKQGHHDPCFQAQPKGLLLWLQRKSVVPLWNLFGYLFLIKHTVP